MNSSRDPDDETGNLCLFIRTSIKLVFTFVSAHEITERVESSKTALQTKGEVEKAR